MLRQNSELRPHRIWNWTLPAWFAVLPDGTRFYTCPHAGICAQYCYARNGTYLFRNVLAAHTANLTAILDSPQTWMESMLDELAKKKYRPTGIARHDLVGVTDDPWLNNWITSGGAAVRIHDSGDFFSDDYLRLWMTIASRTPDVLFYAYTKEVSLVRPLLSEFPSNLRVLFSTGGTEDHLLDPDSDRHADVFPTEDHIVAAGYASQDASDLLAVILPTPKIGIPANNIKHFNKKLAGRRFAEAVPVRIRLRGLSDTDLLS